MNSNVSKTSWIPKTRKSKQHYTALVFGLSVVMIFATLMPYSLAESQTTTLDDNVSLEKTTAIMSVPKDNIMPWGAVKGTIDDPAQGYPVIIQFFNEKNGDDPVHVAQVDVKGDDTYEYKFRVRDVNLETGEVTNIFEGDYTVKIFKVVNTSPDAI